MQAKLDALLVRHRILPIMQLLLVGPGKSPASPSKGMVTLSSKFLESGLTLSFSDTFQTLIHHVDLGPGQLNPNVWRAMAGSIIL